VERVLEGQREEQEVVEDVEAVIKKEDSKFT